MNNVFDAIQLSAKALKIDAYATDVAVFAEKKEFNKEQLEAVILNQNFRSRTEVISFVNFCFDALMSETCGGVLYNDDHALVKGADYDETAHPTKVLFIDNDPVFKKENSFSRENYECAKMIKEMLEKGEPVNDKGELRACRPGDFCILVQTNAEGRAASAALEAVGLKSYTKDTDGYLNSREIQLVVNILRVIDNPMKDIPMAAVMLSPIMGFDPDEAARVAEFATKGKKKRHFWQVLVASDESKEIHRPCLRYHRPYGHNIPLSRCRQEACEPEASLAVCTFL